MSAGLTREANKKEILAGSSLNFHGAGDECVAAPATKSNGEAWLKAPA
jgi:hypothetical protein